MAERRRALSGLALAPASCVLALAFVLAACGNDPTPASAVVLEQSLESEANGPIEGADEVAHEVALEGGASVQVELVTGQSGAGRVLRSVRVVAVNPAGATLSGELIGTPTNVGTAEAPIHARIVQLTETRSGLTGSSLNQTSFTVRADGRVEKN